MNNRLPLRKHFQELRSRLLIWLTYLVLFSFVGYFLSNYLITFLLGPLGQPIFYTNPAGGFEFVLKISIFFGLILSLPVLIYQTFQFLAPSLKQEYRNKIRGLVFVSFLLGCLGVAYGYFVTLPVSLYFLQQFSDQKVKALITTDAYFNFATGFLLVFSIAFQLPLVIYFANLFVKLTVKKLMKFQPYIIALAFIVGAIFTPSQDIINQALLAVPLIMLYQLSILIIWLQKR